MHAKEMREQSITSKHGVRVLYQCGPERTVLLQLQRRLHKKRIRYVQRGGFDLDELEQRRVLQPESLP